MCLAPEEYFVQSADFGVADIFRNRSRGFGDPDGTDIPFSILKAGRSQTDERQKNPSGSLADLCQLLLSDHVCSGLPGAPADPTGSCAASFNHLRRSDWDHDIAGFTGEVWNVCFVCNSRIGAFFNSLSRNDCSNGNLAVGDTSKSRLAFAYRDYPAGRSREKCMESPGQRERIISLSSKVLSWQLTLHLRFLYNKGPTKLVSTGILM